ncbi:type II toxin-antitoxin system VapC family toxin [Atribacter laminatus]|uniref:Ribonuclease VapC5 n=1 Tax=Atribacter laminatus TaxID=2847778 RepID=A0A7T1F1S3_ATRLM|nr:type II toxin-antitoxin system VapC family toxin [Atribacter laminatus]QPM67050.1 Ribonuclease VapC5 [Atribacter laminatus]
MNILIDTNAYASFKYGEETTVAILQKAELIGLSVIVIGELLSGFRLGKYEKQNCKELNDFIASTRVRILFIDENTTYYYSMIYHQLKEKGKPIPTNDLWIAATAFQNGLPIFTYDRHFSEIDGLLVINSPELLI